MIKFKKSSPFLEMILNLQKVCGLKNSHNTSKYHILNSLQSVSHLISTKTSIQKLLNS